MKAMPLLLLVACGGAAPEPARPAPAPAPAAKPPPQEEPTAAIVRDDAARIAELLTSESPTDVTGEITSRRPPTELGKQLEEAKRDSVAIGGRSRSGGVAATGRAPSVGPGNVTAGTGARPKDAPAGKIIVASKVALDTTTLTPDAVVAKIASAYMAGISRCYRSYLAKDPAAAGRLKLAFSVSAKGNIRSAKARELNAEVDHCVTEWMARWRFPPPADSSGDPTDASFEITLTLTPS